MNTSNAPAPTPAEMYEQFYVPAMFGPWARILVGRAAPGRGEAVLDLACGTGIVARTAAPLVGKTGKVVALDLRPGMLAAARSLPQPEGAVIDWVEGDAVKPDLPGTSFDHVICQAGLQFFPDRVGALGEALRMLKDGGKLAVLVWQGLDRHPVWDALAVSELKHLAPVGVTREELVMPFALGDKTELRGLLEQAGFRDIEIAEETHEARFPGADDFIRNMEYAYAAVIPEFVADPAAFAGFVEAVAAETRDMLRAFREDDYIVFPMHANIATARK